MLRDRAHDVLRADGVRHESLDGVVLAGGDLLHRGGVEDNVGPLQQRNDGGIVADVADAEVQPVMSLLVVDDVVRRNAAVLEGSRIAC